MANYNINYEDERFTDVEKAKDQALIENEQIYGGMISESDKYYQEQMNAADQWADKQSQIQQENTDFALEKLNQQKDQANKDYKKEQSGAYVDWQKQSNQYGANAEQMAANGMAGTGYSESAQVSMYNTYQNRVAVARESYNKAVLEYDNAMKEAILQNNATLAEIAYTALQKKLELSLQGFQYKNQLLLDQQNKKAEIDDRYYSRYQDVIDQMNYENEMAEQIRQYEQNYQMQVKQYEESIRQFEQEYAFQVKQFDESIRQFDEEMARLKKKDAEEYAMEIQRLELQKQQFEEQKRQAEIEYQLQRQQLAEEKRQFDLSYAEEQRQFNLANQQNTGIINNNSGSKYYLPTADDLMNGKYAPSTENGGGSRAFGYSTYEDAAAYLRSIGSTGDSGLMTKNEWTRRKASGSNSPETSYSSYTEYLNYFVSWKRSTLGR